MSEKILAVEGWEALDSRGNPTVAIAVVASGGARAKALAPAGASAGSYEALFLRDGGKRYAGKSVWDVVHRALPLLRGAWIGLELNDPVGLEKALREIDSSPHWATLGGNVATAASVAAWLTLAASQSRAPWEIISEWTGATPLLPVPMVNIVSGGAHAERAVAIQDVLAIPAAAKSVEEAIEAVWKIRGGTAECMRDLRFSTALVADEGGLAAPFASSEAAIKVVTDGIARGGFSPGEDASIALDIAANEFLGAEGKYDFEGDHLSEESIVTMISRWVADWPITSVEDPLAENGNWSLLASMLEHTQVVGDDRYATSVARLSEGIVKKEANSVLVKPNQAGTLWEALRALGVGKKAGWGTIVSARSGDTEEDWLVDLAVGSGAGQIKVGSTMRSERTAKWNRMLELSAEGTIRYAAIETE